MMNTDLLIQQLGWKTAAHVVGHRPTYVRCCVCDYSLLFGRNLVYRTPSGAFHCDGCVQDNDTAVPALTVPS